MDIVDDPNIAGLLVGPSGDPVRFALGMRVYLPRLRQFGIINDLKLIGPNRDTTVAIVQLDSGETDQFYPSELQNVGEQVRTDWFTISGDKDA